MDAATILVTILCVGVVILLVWFEMNSRRNQASMKTAVSAQPTPTVSQPQNTASTHSADKEKKAA